ncbi:MAG: alkyl hydroperoxide reductase/Thiol specific antioxidant/Mal allergen [Solirubrobacterales bacterium]|nr:alkyl hydroperoxide reductase/Thiol specific antioxidant/Mal allergen [Solirubrobacterales bacterium]
MITGGTLSSAARRLTDRLLGLEIPSVVLDGGWERPLDLHEVTREHGVVLYFYPGCSKAHTGGEDIAMMDAAQHRAFGRDRPDLELRGYVAIGVSSQSKESQRQSVLANRVSHKLLCDPELQIAQAIGLPIFPHDGTCWYQRLMLVTSEGFIEKVFFPVSNPSRSAAQIITWMTVHGIFPGATDDAG